jgi:hypothetical protein
VLYPRWAAAQPLREPKSRPGILNKAERMAYWVAAQRLLQTLMRKARKAADPRPPQKDSTIEAP